MSGIDNSRVASGRGNNIIWCASSSSVMCAAAGGGDGDDNPWDRTKYSVDCPVFHGVQEEELWVYPTPQVVILGHSFIRRLHEYLVFYGGFFFNMGLDYSQANVHMLYRGGMTVKEARFEYLHAIMAHEPDIVYIELGTNDRGGS